ncbi:MAG: hypothetical protein JWM44_2192 [Bacilli bacterium]|nr:hypothetical protein [Bacilli bacterium]
MRNHQIMKLLSVLMIVCIMFTSFGVVFGATTAAVTDISNHWAKTQVTDWISKGYISGYVDGTFKPDNTITRAEFIKLINKSFDFKEKKADIKYSDVNVKDWYYEEVQKAAKEGYITGYEDGSIGANKPISRQEVAVIISRLLKLQATDNSSVDAFSDADQIADWGKDAIGEVVDKKIMNGYAADLSFKPGNSIKRAEAVVALDKAIHNQVITYSTAGTFGPATGSQTVIGDSVINVTGVKLQNMIINGNLLLDEGIGSGDAYLTNVTVKGTTTVNGGGENSIHFSNSTLSDVVIDKKGGTVRVVSEGATSVNQITVHSAATVEGSGGNLVNFQNVILSDDIPTSSKVTLKGSIGKLNVDGTSLDIQIPSGNVKEVNVSETATGNSLNIGKTTKIDALMLDSSITQVGQGTITRATLNDVAKGSTFEKQPLSKVDKPVAADPNSVPAATPVPTATPVPASTSAPIIKSVVAANAGNNVGLGIGDTLTITFDKNTNRTALKAVNLGSVLLVNNGHRLGNNLSDGNISWNSDGNILTITFSNTIGTTFAVGDTITVSTSANIKNSTGNSAASNSASGASTGSFSSAPYIISIVAANTGNNTGLGIGDTVAITFDQNMARTAISAANLNTWLVLSNGHSFGTNLSNGDIFWNATGNILTIRFSNITGVTFTLGDSITISTSENMKDSGNSIAASNTVSGSSTGNFSTVMTITSIVAANTGNNLGLGVGDSVTITFNKPTNKPSLTPTNLNYMLYNSSGHSFGTNLLTTDIVWTSASVLTIRFSTTIGTTFTVGDALYVSEALNLTDSTNTVSMSSDLSVASTGTFTIPLAITSVVAADTGNNSGVGVGDTITITFNQNTNKLPISGYNWTSYLYINNSHSLGTSLRDADFVWNTVGNVLTITLSSITGTTFTVGDTVTVIATSNIRDSSWETPAVNTPSPPSSGTFTSAVSVSKAALNVAISAANTVIANAVVGTAVGQYSQVNKDILNTAITTAQNVANSSASSSSMETAKNTLNAAVTVFQNTVGKTSTSSSKTALNSAITLAQTTSDNAAQVTIENPNGNVGSDPGQYPTANFNALNLAIAAATAVAANTTANQSVVDAAKNTLNAAVAAFNASKIPTIRVQLQSEYTKSKTLIGSATVGTNTGQIPIENFQDAFDAFNSTIISVKSYLDDINTDDGTLELWLETLKDAEASFITFKNP